MAAALRAATAIPAALAAAGAHAAVTGPGADGRRGGTGVLSAWLSSRLSSLTRLSPLTRLSALPRLPRIVLPGAFLPRIVSPGAFPPGAFPPGIAEAWLIATVAVREARAVVTVTGRRTAPAGTFLVIHRATLHRAVVGGGRVIRRAGLDNGRLRGITRIVRIAAIGRGDARGKRHAQARCREARAAGTEHSAAARVQGVGDTHSVLHGGRFGLRPVRDVSGRSTCRLFHFTSITTIPFACGTFPCGAHGTVRLFARPRQACDAGCARAG